MKTKDFQKLATKTLSELQKEVQKLQQELVDLRMDKQLNKEKNVRRYKTKRQDLAKIKTLITQKTVIQEG